MNIQYYFMYASFWAENVSVKMIFGLVVVYKNFKTVEIFLAWSICLKKILTLNFKHSQTMLQVCIYVYTYACVHTHTYTHTRAHTYTDKSTHETLPGQVL